MQLKSKYTDRSNLKIFCIILSPILIGSNSHTCGFQAARRKPSRFGMCEFKMKEIIVHRNSQITEKSGRNKRKNTKFFNRGRARSVGRALDCRAGGGGFDS